MIEKLKQKIESVKGSIFVGLFLVLLFAAFCHEAKAETSLEIGPTYLSHDLAGGAFLIREDFGKYSAFIGYFSKQEVVPREGRLYKIQENIMLGAQRVVRINRFELGIGPSYFQNTNRALGAKFTIGLSVGYHFNDHLSLRVRHWSNAGSAAPNMGQDALTIAWKF